MSPKSKDLPRAEFMGPVNRAVSGRPAPVMSLPPPYAKDPPLNKTLVLNTGQANAAQPINNASSQAEDSPTNTMSASTASPQDGTHT
ncbi:hypothetical protein BDV93DRAFT_612127 [Ceratobasidium sp. AG-I]|nr:hypothetical protein BDV93DRAFT_612127 [Ceratobasidium sp. AG-I]